MAPGWARVIWFIFVRWWLGMLWIGISLLVMLTIILFPLGAYMISKAWEVMTLKTSPATVIQERPQGGQVGTGKTGSAESKEYFNINPTEFAYVEFGTTKDAKLEYSIDVHDGPAINSIVAYKKNLPDFSESTNIGWVQKASAVNKKHITKEAVINPGDYVIILDNIGRFRDQVANGPVDVTIEYEVIK
jgi:hypothetical protein